MRRLLCVAVVACRGPAPAEPQLVFDHDLLGGLRAEPWRDPPGTSEQYFPLFVGATVRELVLGRAPATPGLRLPIALRALGEGQARRIASTLRSERVELEAWPTIDWNGQPNWVFARWRSGAGAPWAWLTQHRNWRASWPQARGAKALLPEQLDPASAVGRRELLADFLDVPDLYHQPRFGNCVYVRRADRSLALAWPDPRERAARASTLGAVDAYCMNQPARLDGKPLALVVTVAGDAVAWPRELGWLPAPAAAPPAVELPLHVTRWPDDLMKRYRDDLAIADGEAEARYPRSGRVARFRAKGVFQPDHDLERMVDYLEERYAALGIETVRQRFVWRGIAQSNLIAIIPGRERLAPVVMADHIDAACEEDTFEKTGRRVTAHGADDNATATAALLAAAEVLRDARPRREVWLVHLTGEEFPGDDLGARHFVSELLREKRDVHGVVITDFIGWHHPGRPRIQISPTAVPGSERMAALALDAARRVAPRVTALYAPRDRGRNSVFQTDLMIFELNGFPGVLFNEDMDYADPSTFNPHYHQSTDVIANLDVPFAVEVAKIAIETVLRIANEEK